MERYLCLDIGDRRIGVAVSDPFNSYSLPVKTYFRKNLKTDLLEISAIAKEKMVTAIVCGLPVNFDGTPSVQTQKAQFFIDKLKEQTGLEIFTIDERCTTCEAEDYLISQGKSREERKSVVDALAASSILQSFLNELKIKSNKENKMDNEKKTCTCGCEEHEHVCDETCDCGCGEDEIFEFEAEDGKKFKFYLIGTIEHKGKFYSAFEPAEIVEGIDEDTIIIYELLGDSEENSELIPVEDEALLDEVFEAFCKALEEDEEFES